MIMNPITKKFKEILVPLKSVTFLGQLEAGLSTINV
jgi:hypothetical protein